MESYSEFDDKSTLNLQADCVQRIHRYFSYSERRRFWGYSPHRGNTLHQSGWNWALPHQISSQHGFI